MTGPEFAISEAGNDGGTCDIFETPALGKNCDEYIFHPEFCKVCGLGCEN